MLISPVVVEVLEATVDATAVVVGAEVGVAVVDAVRGSVESAAEPSVPPGAQAIDKTHTSVAISRLNPTTIRRSAAGNSFSTGTNSKDPDPPRRASSRTTPPRDLLLLFGEGEHPRHGECVEKPEVVAQVPAPLR